MDGTPGGSHAVEVARLVAQLGADETSSSDDSSGSDDDSGGGAAPPPAMKQSATSPTFARPVTPPKGRTAPPPAPVVARDVTPPRTCAGPDLLMPTPEPEVYSRADVVARLAEPRQAIDGTEPRPVMLSPAAAARLRAQQAPVAVVLLQSETEAEDDTGAADGLREALQPEPEQQPEPEAEVESPKSALTTFRRAMGRRRLAIQATNALRLPSQVRDRDKKISATKDASVSGWRHGEVFFEGTNNVAKFLLVPDECLSSQEVLSKMLSHVDGWCGGMPVPEMTVSVHSAAGDPLDPVQTEWRHGYEGAEFDARWDSTQTYRSRIAEQMYGVVRSAAESNMWIVSGEHHKGGGLDTGSVVDCGVRMFKEVQHSDATRIVNLAFASKEDLGIRPDDNTEPPIGVDGRIFETFRLRLNADNTAPLNRTPARQLVFPSSRDTIMDLGGLNKAGNNCRLFIREEITHLVILPNHMRGPLLASEVRDLAPCGATVWVTGEDAATVEKVNRSAERGEVVVVLENTGPICDYIVAGIRSQLEIDAWTPAEQIDAGPSGRGELDDQMRPLKLTALLARAVDAGVPVQELLTKLEEPELLAEWEQEQEQEQQGDGSGGDVEQGVVAGRGGGGGTDLKSLADSLVWRHLVAKMSTLQTSASSVQAAKSNARGSGTPPRRGGGGGGAGGNSTSVATDQASLDTKKGSIITLLSEERHKWERRPLSVLEEEAAAQGASAAILRNALQSEHPAAVLTEYIWRKKNILGEQKNALFMSSRKGSEPLKLAPYTVPDGIDSACMLTFDPRITRASEITDRVSAGLARPGGLEGKAIGYRGSEERRLRYAWELFLLFDYNASIMRTRALTFQCLFVLFALLATFCATIVSASGLSPGEPSSSTADAATAEATDAADGNATDTGEDGDSEVGSISDIYVSEYIYLSSNIQTAISLACALLPMLSTFLFSVQGKLNYRKRWEILTAAAERVKSEIYCYRARVKEYESSGKTLRLMSLVNNPSSVTASKVKADPKRIMFVGKIGIEGWDPDGDDNARGWYASEEKLEGIFSRFGKIVGVHVRHSIKNGANTSWALVVMDSADAVDRAISAGRILAGKTELEVTRFNMERAENSSGAMVTMLERINHAFAASKAANSSGKRPGSRVGGVGRVDGSRNKKQPSDHFAANLEEIQVDLAAEIVMSSLEQPTIDAGHLLKHSLYPNVLSKDFEESEELRHPLEHIWGMSHKKHVQLSDFALPSTKGMLVKDDGIGPISGADYIRFRLHPKMHQLAKTVVWHERKHNMGSIMILFGTLCASVLGVIGLRIWIPAVGAYVSAVESMMSFEETQTKLIGANSALTGLKNLRIFWLSITRMQQEKPANIAYMIGSAESALELEWSAWTQGMLKKKEIKPEEESDGRDENGGANDDNGRAKPSARAKDN